jgi:hypothetical protein
MQKRAGDGRDTKEEDNLLGCLERALEAMKSTRQILLRDQTMAKAARSSA